jgi:hypothetical protein
MKNFVAKHAESNISESFTSQPPIVPPIKVTAAFIRESEFFRPPGPRHRCPLSGLSRTSILEHGEVGEFRIIRLRKRGSQRGVVLIETASFLQWLHGQPSVIKETGVRRSENLRATE